MSKLNTKGFTLLELLVVIALIGIFASIAMVALTAAKNDGEDTALRASLNKLQTQAELYFSNFGNYGSNTSAYSAVCPTVATASSTAGMMGVSGSGLLIFNIAHVQKVGSANTLCTVAANGTAWAVAVRLKGDTTKVVCVDSTGKSNVSVATLASTITSSACN